MLEPFAGVMANVRSAGFFFSTLLSLAGSFQVLADSWAPPKTVEVFSSNSNYLAKTEPAWHDSELKSPILTVFKQDKSSRLPLWRANLSNKVAPVEVLLTDDGEYVVTLDNYHAVGYGDEVVAFYGGKGLIRKYSLEAALADAPGNGEASDWLGHFVHSVSSRWWRSHSLMFFDGAGTNASFGIWLDWAARWFVWRLADGAPVKLGGEVLKRWNLRGHQWALERLAEPEVTNRPSREELLKWTAEAREWSSRKGARYQNQITACRYLAFNNYPGDRVLLEGLLGNPEENANWDLPLRIDADRALAILDGQAINFGHEGIEKMKLFRLGRVDLTIEFPQIPGKDEGQLYVSIFPETVKESVWPESPAEFRTGKGFKWSGTDGKLALKVVIPPLRPGGYWVKAVWARTPPSEYNLSLYEGMREWKESRKPAPVATTTDFESGRPEVFRVKAGQTTTVNVKCTQPGTNSRR